VVDDDPLVVELTQRLRIKALSPGGVLGRPEHRLTGMEERTALSSTASMPKPQLETVVR
jgi:hypothetical protein